MTIEQGKKLTKTRLNKLESELNERSTILVYQNQFSVNVYKVFRESIIEKVISAYVDILEQIQKEADVQGDMIKGSIILFHTLILREFTDLPIPKTDDVESLITVSNTLLDTGIIEEVFNAIPVEEMNKIEDKLISVQNNFEQIINRKK